jgi:hypothetical protein
METSGHGTGVHMEGEKLNEEHPLAGRSQFQAPGGVLGGTN